MSMNENDSHALKSGPSMSEPAPSTDTPYHGKNMTMKSATPLAPATISPKLILEVSTRSPVLSWPAARCAI